METYQEFLNRIDSFEKKEINYGDGYFTGNPSISEKVDRDNHFRSFFGDTVVFALEDGVKKRLSGLVDILYRAAPACFCERLAPHTFHVTLHDLGNAPVLRDVAEELFENELMVIEKWGKYKNRGNIKIKMRGKSIFNMVGTSLVLGLYPVNEEEYRRLMGLYSVFDDVKKLNYPFTPHITLAYYNVNGFDRQAAGCLKEAVERLNAGGSALEIELKLEALYYQKFRSMNDYVDVIPLHLTAPI